MLNPYIFISQKSKHKIKFTFTYFYTINIHYLINYLGGHSYIIDEDGEKVCTRCGYVCKDEGAKD